MAALVLALPAGACSVSYPLYDQPKDDVVTGSIGGAPKSDVIPAGKPDPVTSAPLAAPSGAAPAASEEAKPAAYAPKTSGEAPALTPSDWAYARGALSLAMSAEATSASVPWANPDSGAYGTFAAVAAPKVENGATCRNFVAGHSARGHEQRLEGTACRTAAGHWEAVAIRTSASRAL